MERFDPAAVAVGAAVRGAIAQAGLSQAETADLVKMSLNSLSRRINGNLPFTWPEMVRIGKATGTTAAELATTAERLARTKAAS